MPRHVPPLRDTQCNAARYNSDSGPGGKGNKLSDGGGLFLLIHPTNSKTWYIKYRHPTSGKENSLSLGEYPSVTLKQARHKRDEVKTLLAHGIDPKTHQREQKVRLRAEQENTFGVWARKWWEAERKARQWSDAYAATYWKRIEADLIPELGTRPLTDLKTRDLIPVIQKIEMRGALVISDRMRQAIVLILRYAVHNGAIDINPASDLTGNRRPRKPKHYPALPLKRLPELWERLENDRGRPLTKLAVQLALLVFIRSSELRFARWSEIDLERGLWEIPSVRKKIQMGEGKVVEHSERGSKMKEAHWVPLAPQAVAVLKKVHELTGKQELVFPGSGKNGKCVLSENTINQTLRRMGYDTENEVCGHGFRTMACSALNEAARGGGWSETAVERQMSHRERNGVRAAYTHAAEFFEERRQMMKWWADYLDANRQQHITPYDYVSDGSRR